MLEQVVAVVGAGLIGRSWAIVFARGGCRVSVHDAVPRVLEGLPAAVEGSLRELEEAGLIEDAGAIAGRISPVADLGEALAGVVHVQENGPERVEIKREIFAELDRLAAGDVTIASSSSGLCASAYTKDLAGRGRCLVAHPINPPHLLPFVELVPAPWTEAAAVDRVYALMERVGQAPIRLTRETEGFVLNRLQGALLNEAMRLVEDGYASPRDVDKAITQGLGIRWSFMGPFETMDLNAPGGVADYCRRYGPMFEAMGRTQADPRAWGAELVDRIAREFRAVRPVEELPARHAWRDKRLVELARHRAEVERKLGK